MAAIGGAVNDGLGAGKKKSGMESQNGLMTPRTSPEVEDGRIDADKTRQATGAVENASANGKASVETEHLHGRDDHSDGKLSDDEASDDDDEGGEENGMDGVEEKNDIPWPTTLVQGVYREATPHLGKLLFKSDDLDALGALRALNDQIKQQNEKDEIQLDQWTIDWLFFASQFEMAKPFYDRLLKRPEGASIDEEAKKKIEEINAQLLEKNTKCHYPADWVINPPTEEMIAQAQAAKKAADNTLAQRRAAAAKKKADNAAAKKKADDDAAAAAKKKADDEAAAAKKKADDDAAAAAAAKEKAAVAATSKFGNIEFPWVTYPLPTGERIIAGRQHTKDSVSGSLCCVEYPCTDPKDPNFGFRDDIDIIELEKYFATPGIKLMGETDDEGRPVKVWRKADRKDFKRFLFCVVGKRKMCDLTKRTKPLCPEVLCGFEMANGIQLATRSGFKNVVGEKPGDGYVRVYCERKGITPPWEVEPEMWAISNTQKAILDRAQNGINLGAGYTTNSSTAINSPPRNPTVGGLELKSLTQKIDTMEKKIEGLQSNNSGSSLDLILKKMEERMASMETKMEQRLDSMDTKMAKVDELATTVVNVTLLVQRLMQQAGMNVAGTNTASA